MRTNEQIIQDIKKLIEEAKPPERIEIMHKVLEGYCRHCGYPEPETGCYCACENDE